MKILLFLVLWFAPEPKPLVDAIPSDTFSRKTETGKVHSWGWGSKSRPTKYWLDGVLWCDNPSCIWCADRVYGIDRGWSDAKRIRR